LAYERKLWMNLEAKTVWRYQYDNLMP